MSVKVGVRVRPFNQRQKTLNCRLCVDMIGPKTILFEADDPQKHRDFTFDYSFWSHDQFHTDDKGYFVPDTDKYADQQHVFEQVGLEILANAWEGYHCCLFAYGQTGAGKSYSMVGYGANKGIVPISCEQIFNRVQKNDNKQKQYEVNVSMLQIYNQKVQDLLVPIAKRQKQGYKIREHKTLGIYVEGLSKFFVDTYEAIQSKMDEGSKNRSIAATQMNASSSRAHTIISIQFRQIDQIQGKKKQKLSVIHLVDLAGSQKVGKTGATGDRLKQAAGINKSLSVLGLVISTLADKAMGKSGKNTIVPYRDSCLTRILQNALGGNSKTLMICAISPANDNYQQTLSTLRYADQAKKIQNKAVINQSETDKIIRNLTQQKEQLRQKVLKFEQMFKKLSQGLGIDPQKLQQLNQAKQQLRFNSMMINDYAMSKSQKIEEAHNIQHQHVQENKVDLTKPHLSNLHQDPQLNKRITYSIDQQIITIGKRNAQPKNDIEIGGINTRSHHATIRKNQSDAFTIEPIQQNQQTGIHLNGNIVTEKTQLKHLDRLFFGSHNLFLVYIPNTLPRQPIEEQKLDWDYSQNELYLKKQRLDRQIAEQKERQIKQQANRKIKQKQAQLAQLFEKLTQQKAQIQKRLKQQQAQRLKRQIQKQKKQIQDQQTRNKQRQKQIYYFQKNLLKIMPLCVEINLIAKQFKRNIHLSAKIFTLNELLDQHDRKKIGKRIVKIQVINNQVGYIYWWNQQKLTNRYYIIKDMLDVYFECGVIPQLGKQKDPFFDPQIPSLIGKAFLNTKSLAYMFDNPSTIPILLQDECGQLDVNMIPTDQTGTKNLCADLEQQQIQFQPSNLLDNPFYFFIEISQARIKQKYKNTFVQYSLKKNQISTQQFKTEQVAQITQNPKFNYKKLHSFQKITAKLLEYLTSVNVIFSLYGTQMIEQASKAQDPSRSPESKKISTLTTDTSATLTPTAITATPSPQKRAQVQEVNHKKVQQKKSDEEQQKVKKQSDKNNKNNKNNKDIQSYMKQPSAKQKKNQKNQKDKKNSKNDKDCRIF